MYKAGDFTNGKMNEIFKNSFKLGESSSYDSSIRIHHRQLGYFHLVSDSGLIMPVLIMLHRVKGFHDHVKPFMDAHNDSLEKDDPSRFFTVASYLNSMDADKILMFFNGFFNLGDQEIKINFTNMFGLLVYLVCEKDCTYSEEK